MPALVTCHPSYPDEPPPFPPSKQTLLPITEYGQCHLQTLILDSAVDVIEKQMGWTLTRQYSFPKLAFKVTPDASQPATLGLRQDTQPGQTRSAAAAPQAS